MKKIFFILLALITNMFSTFADSWIQKADFAGSTLGNTVSFAINGKGYVGTGSPIFTVGKSFWEYDPADDAWTQKADLPGAGRENASGFSIGNKGYMGLGRTDDCCYTDDFWEYDPATNSWTQKASFPGGARAGAFAFSTATKGYAGGGSKNLGFKQDFWEYEPATDAWTQKANYGGGKVSYLPAFTINDKGYVGTGYDNTIQFRNDFWEYDPPTNLWTKKADLPGGTRYGSVGFSIGDLGYLGLGATFDTTYAELWQYDPLADSWIQKTDFPSNPSAGAAAFSIDMKGYVGIAGGKEFWQYTPDCETPTGLTTTNIKSTSARVSWNIVLNAQTYSVRYRKTGTVPWTKVTAQTNSKKLTGLSSSTEYDWAVKSVCDAVNHVSSDWSATQNFTTKPLRLENGDEEISFEIFPNPVSSTATISFYLAKDSKVLIELFSVDGKKISMITNEKFSEGNNHVNFNRELFATGIYFLKLKSDDQTSTVEVVIE